MVGLLIAGGVKAQNKTIKLYLQQIDANKVYIEYLEKGYQIAKGGLTTISGIKDGHFQLDKTFFRSLEEVNPKLSTYASNLGIVSIYLKILREAKIAFSQAKSAEVFNTGEIGYFEIVFNSILQVCGASADELGTLLSAGKFKMSDDERKQRIDRVYANLREQYCFVKSFSNDIKLAILQRAKEKQDAAVVRKAYGY